ncbi:uncharacterized protein LOC143920572 [Arctopsyche grandis]|uniref:uncharacterized protein LOC143920572 n=1 Tax=Arctopsyche grandis TaxID=121162 RepID=UPI00406D7906
MEPSSSKTPEKSPELSLEQRLKHFATSFVTELESILTFHHGILEGTIQKSGKIPEVATTVVGLIVGQIPGISEIKGVDKLVKFSQPVFEKPFQVLEKNKSLKYHDIVYGYHEDKDKGRQLFVDIAFDVFESYESQFNGITSQRGPHKAIQRVAKDAAQRFLNSFKSYGESYSEKKFQKFSRSTKQTFKPQLPPSKNDFKLNAQKVIEGKSKSQSDIVPDKVWKPGYEIQYKCKDGCEKIHNDWRTSNLFDEVGVSIKKEDSEDYYVHVRNISNSDKYGYRRLLRDEILNTKYGCTVKCQRTCMHPQYLQHRDFYDSKRTTILKSINAGDGAAVNRRILKFVDQAKTDLENIKDEVQKQGNESRNHVLMLIDSLKQSLDNISIEHKQILEKISNKLDEVKKFCQTNMEMTCTGNRDILHEVKITQEQIEKVTSIITNEKKTNDPILFHIMAPVKSFEGRKEELKIIHEALMKKSTAMISQAASVVGLGGIGKTELSKKYAHEYQGYYCNRVFINSEKSETIQNSFKELATQIGIRRCFEKERDIFVREIYSHLNKNGKSLVIFDNVEDYKTIKPFIFNGSTDDNFIHTLITSRCQKWDIGEKGDIKVIGLNKFTEYEAVAYLSKYLKDEDEADLKSLNSLLDGLPLAIRQVVGYINQQNEDSIWDDSEIFKVKDYVQLYKDQWTVLLSKGPDGEDDVCDKTIATTWTITMTKFEQIGEYGQSALSILKIISYLAPDDIDVKKIFLKFETDKPKLEKAVKLLRDYSMVNVEKGIVGVHRLVQRAVQMYLIEKNEDEKYLLKALKLLEESYFQEHIVSVWEHLSNYPQIVKDVYDCSKYSCWRVTPMHLLAYYRNDVIAMAKICKHVSYCVNCEDVDGNFPLHNATRNKNMSLDVVKFLVEQGADVNCKDYANDTPLNCAINHADINVVRFLVENGADLNFNKNSNNPIPLNLAIRKGYEEIVKYLVTKTPKNLKDNANDTSLDVAVFQGHDKIVEIMRINYNSMDFFHACLKKALKMRDIEKCLEIIQNLKMTESHSSESLLNESAALHIAVQYSNVNVIEYLLYCGMDVDKLDENKNTPLCFAVKNNKSNIKIFENLLYHGANPNRKFKNGETGLHYTARNGAVDVLKLLISKGADPNTRDEKDRSPFHWAAEGGNVVILQFLIDIGVDIDMPDIYGETPLFIAARYNKCEALHYILKLGANPNVINKKGETLLHYTAKNGAVDVFELLLSKGADPNIRDEKNRSTLHWAAEGTLVDIEHKNVDTLHFLIDKGVDIDMPDKDGETPLLIAALKYKDKATEYLLELGANPNSRNKKGQTVLHYVARTGHVFLFESLLSKGADPNIRDKDDRSPFHCAAEIGSVHILKLFIDKGFDIDMPDKDGVTPLCIAASNYRFDAVEYLIKSKANPNAKNKKGETVLHCSARKGALYISAVLLGKGADPNIQDKVGRLPIHCAAEGGNVNILQIFINKGVKVDTADNSGETPLFLAAYHGQFEAIKHLIKNGANSKIVSKRGMTLLQKAANKCDVNALKFVEELGFELTAVDKFGKTLLHLAAHGGNKAAIEYLIERGINPNITDKFERTPLHDIPYGSSFNMTSFEILIKLGANPNAMSESNHTPLHFAAIKNNKFAASLLIEEGAAINACSKLGRTALHYASAKCHDWMIGFLLEKGAEVSVFDSKGRSPLYHLSHNGEFKLVKRLLKRGADPRKLDKAGHSLLHLAAVHFRYCAVDEIIREVVGIDVNARDVRLQTPLHLAAKSGRVVIVGLLVRHGANTSATDKSGNTPLDYTVKFNRTKAMNFLKSKSSGTQESHAEISTSN